MLLENRIRGITLSIKFVDRHGRLGLSENKMKNHLMRYFSIGTLGFEAGFQVLVWNIRGKLKEIGSVIFQDHRFYEESGVGCRQNIP